MNFEEALGEQARKLQIIFDRTPTSILLLFVVAGCAVIGVSVFITLDTPAPVLSPSYC